MEPLLVTAAIIQKQDRILLTLRPEDARHGGMWEFPGGKLDPGESPAEGLAREVLEELGLLIQVGPIFEVVYHRYDWGPVLILAYLARPLENEIHHLGVADHRWVTPAQLSEFPILPADRPIIDKLQDSTIPAWD